MKNLITHPLKGINNAFKSCTWCATEFFSSFLSRHAWLAFTLVLIFAVTSLKGQSYLDTVPVPDAPQYDFDSYSYSSDSTIDSILNEKFTDFQVYEFDKSSLVNYVDTQNYVISFDLRFKDGSGTVEKEWKFRGRKNDLTSEDFTKEYSDSMGRYTDTSSFYPADNLKGELIGNSSENFARITASPVDFNVFVMVDTQAYFLEPLQNLIDSAPSDKYVYYNGEDVKSDTAIKCGADYVDMEDVELSYPEGSARSGPCDPLTLEIATDATVEFNNVFNGQPGGTFGRIISILNQVEGLYNYYYNINFQVNYMHKWTGYARNDPYSQSSISTMLGQLRSKWENDPFFSTVPRDVTHLYADWDNSSTAGIAYVGTVCGSPDYAYSVSENRFEPNYKQVVITSHEFGHNLSAGHVSSGCNGYGPVMCPWVQYGAFYMENSTQNSINYHLNNYSSCMTISSTPSYNNGWEKLYTNDARHNWIGSWHIKDEDIYKAGDFDGDGEEELFEVHPNSGWHMMQEYDCTEWKVIYHNGGNRFMAGWMIQPGDRYYPGDFDGDGNDDILCVSGNSDWAMVLEYNGTKWVTSWSNGGNGYIENWKIRGDESFLVNDFTGNGSDELLAFDHSSSPYGMMQSWQGLYWQIEWTNFGNGTIGNKNLNSDIVYGGGDFNSLNNNTWDELLVLDASNQVVPELLLYQNGTWSSLWSGTSSNTFANWSLTSSLSDEIHVGDIDESDDYDEILFIEKSSAQNASSIDYDASTGDFQENWNNSGTTPYIHDWDLGLGSDKNYVLIKPISSRREYLLNIRKQPSGWPHLASMYRTSVTSSNYKRKEQAVDDVSESNLMIYPNPTNGTLHIQGLNFDGYQDYTISIHSINGRLIYSEVFNGMKLDNTIELNDVPTGIYVVEIVTESEAHNQQVVIK